MLFSKWYWRDFDADQGLRACSHGAQALWMRLMSIAAQNEPVGYVSINGVPLSVADIAQQTGWTQEEATAEIAELERRGVFSRDRRGCIYSRRIVKDQKRLRCARDNGKLGGNPTLVATAGNHNGKSASDNHQDKGRHKTSHKARGRANPETRIQNPPYTPPNNYSNGSSPGPAQHYPGALGRMNLSSGAYIDQDGVYRLPPELRAKLEAKLAAERAADQAEPDPDPPDQDTEP
jgi:hypothetical protein